MYESKNFVTLRRNFGEKPNIKIICIHFIELERFVKSNILKGCLFVLSHSHQKNPIRKYLEEKSSQFQKNYQKLTNYCILIKSFGIYIKEDKL